jgi:hypothetical protein
MSIATENSKSSILPVDPRVKQAPLVIKPTWCTFADVLTIFVEASRKGCPGWKSRLHVTRIGYAE